MLGTPGAQRPANRKGRVEALAAGQTDGRQAHGSRKPSRKVQGLLHAGRGRGMWPIVAACTVLTDTESQRTSSVSGIADLGLILSGSPAAMKKTSSAPAATVWFTRPSSSA